MGELIDFTERMADRSRTAGPRPAFFFDLACPFSYLAAEQVNRMFDLMDWVPTAAALMDDGDHPRYSIAQLERAERQAAELRLPLVWPERFPAALPSALRAATYAADADALDRFALAASRLAFCGGFDLEDPEMLAEAAGAAGIPLEETLQAARDRDRNFRLHATASGLRRRGLSTLPVICVGTRWFQGEHAAAAAIELTRIKALYGASVAPVG